MLRKTKPAEDYQAEFQKVDRALVREVVSILITGVLVGLILAAIHLWG